MKARKILVALHPAMLDEADEIAKKEHRTRSDLVREALRRYIQEFQKKLENQKGGNDAT